MFQLGYGLEAERATVDVDFAVEVANWSSYRNMREALVARGFIESKRGNHQRVASADGAVVDIVPFGGVADEEQMIRWPPDHAIAMSVLGFPEACANALQVIVMHDQTIAIPVASPAGLTLLKLISWSDRDADKRRKDAVDLRYVLEGFERIPHETSGIYDAIELLEAFDCDTRLVGAAVLAQRTRRISSPQSAAYVTDVLMGRRRTELINDLTRPGHDETEAEQLVDAFLRGYRDG